MLSQLIVHFEVDQLDERATCRTQRKAHSAERTGRAQQDTQARF
jgi:hypothetical protein